MILRLIKRPVAVTMCVIALTVVCILSLRGLPVSLMPDIDIPRITVNVPMPGASVREVETRVAAPLRGQLMQIAGIKEIRSESKTDGTTITMEFTPGSRMDLLFIEANEKVDRAMGMLPEGMERPKVVKAGATDIPAFYIDVYSDDDSEEGFARLSDYVTGVVRKRVEQLPQTAMVDVSGDTKPEIVIEPYAEKTEALGITPEQIGAAVSSADLRLEALSVADGAYRYSLHFDSQMSTLDDIRNITLRHDGRLLRLGDLCRVSQRQKGDNGSVRHGENRAISLAVIKQNDARMEDLKESVEGLLEEVRRDNLGVKFVLTRDQTSLLSYSINNLSWNLALGIALACLVLFAFIRDVRIPLLIVVSIPLSLLLTMLCFKLAGISINVISLAGLILGVGMMVDNSIIVIDNITRLADEGKPLDDAVALGASEVFTPMLSSVLTTCSVFIPLIFLSGTAGALFYDQAMAVTISLFSSLAVAMLVIPVYFRVFFKRKGVRMKHREDGSVPLVERVYNRVLAATLAHPWKVALSIAVLVGVGVACGLGLRKERMPDVSHTDMLVTVDWNEGVSLNTNEERMAQLRSRIKGMAQTTTTMAGSQGFILSHTPGLSSSESVMYVAADSEDRIAEIKDSISGFVRGRYPAASLSYAVSGNVYDMIFSSDMPDLEIRLQTATGGLPDVARSRSFCDSLATRFPDVEISPVATEENLRYEVAGDVASLYGIGYSRLYSRLRELAGSNSVYTINDGSHSVPVIVGAERADRYGMLQNSIRTNEGVDVPLSTLLRERRGEDYKHLYASSSGAYYPVGVDADDRTVESVMDEVKARVNRADSGLSVLFAGAYFDSRRLIGELMVVLAVALAMLYFILAAQFESMLQPLIILSEVAVDIAAVLIALWIAGESLNLMSMIGVVVMCGIIINDSILKIDTINRLRRGGMKTDAAIITAGHQRLKPIIMTSLTTILAVAPFLTRGDMGSDLQFPLSFTLIVGMTVGTLVSLFIIPLFYKLAYD